VAIIVIVVVPVVVVVVVVVVIVVVIAVVETSKKIRKGANCYLYYSVKSSKPRGVHEIPTHSQRAKATQM